VVPTAAGAEGSAGGGVIRGGVEVGDGGRAEKVVATRKPRQGMG